MGRRAGPPPFLFIYFCAYLNGKQNYFLFIPLSGSPGFQITINEITRLPPKKQKEKQQQDSKYWTVATLSKGEAKKQLLTFSCLEIKRDK